MPVTHGFVQGPADDPAGKKADDVVVTTDQGTVHRQVAALGDPSDPEGLAVVKTAAPASNDPALAVRAVAPGGATVGTPVDQSGTVVTLLAANTARRGVRIRNKPQSDVAVLYLKYGAAASPTSWTDEVLPSQTFVAQDDYTGIITGIWSAAGSGKAYVTEIF